MESIRVATKSIDASAIELIKLKKSLDELLTRFETYQLNLENEKRACTEAYQRVILRLLEIIDEIKPDASFDTHRGEYLRTRMTDALGREGITALKVQNGEAFDPLRHTVLSWISDPNQPEYTINEVFQTGYEQKGKVIRKAGVSVFNKGDEK
ncbi:MAG: nucleotide exchange factor GrpE [Methanospirillum sp.]